MTSPDVGAIIFPYTTTHSVYGAYYGILRHITVYYGVLRHITAQYGILRCITISISGHLIFIKDYSIIDFYFTFFNFHLFSPFSFFLISSLLSHLFHFILFITIMSKLNKCYLEHHQNKNQNFSTKFLQHSILIPFHSLLSLIFPVPSYHPISSILFLLLPLLLSSSFIFFFFFSPLSSSLAVHLLFHLFNLTSLLNSPFLLLLCECVHVCCIFFVLWCVVCVLSTDIRFFFIYISG